MNKWQDEISVLKYVIQNLQWYELNFSWSSFSNVSPVSSPWADRHTVLLCLSPQHPVTPKVVTLTHSTPAHLFIHQRYVHYKPVNSTHCWDKRKKGPENKQVLLWGQYNIRKNDIIKNKTNLIKFTNQ